MVSSSLLAAVLRLLAAGGCGFSRRGIAASRGGATASSGRAAAAAAAGRVAVSGVKEYLTQRKEPNRQK